MRTVILLSLLALGACSSGLAMPEGQWHQLNAGKWNASPNDLTTPPPGSQPGTLIGHV